MINHLDTLLGALESAAADGTFAKLTLGAYRGPDSSLRKIVVKLVSLARGEQLSFIYRHANKDVTKNFPLHEGLALLRALVGSDFMSAHLFTTAKNMQLTYDKKLRTRLRSTAPTHLAAGSRQHNHPKNRPVASAGTPYLALLGVTTDDGAVKKGMEAKFRQINKFIEIIETLLRAAPLKNGAAVTVTDMGSGKGYLTFALYDYLTATLKKQAFVTGVEARQELVDLCNDVARRVGFANLRFEAGSIEEHALPATDVVIALHACDTATDQALFKAIQAQAALVVCAPCCHKELRPQIECAVPGLAKILRSGILLERQAELLTDGMRSLLLEAHGYKTKVFEFISTEHTSKNVMIAGVRSQEPIDGAAALHEIETLKTAFGVKHQYLQELLRGSQSTPV